METLPAPVLAPRSGPSTSNRSANPSEAGERHGIAADPRSPRLIDELLPDILDGTIEPGRVFDRSVDLDGVLDGYRAMADRESIKVMIEP
jgi:threonine dehydrogenase-like Zn-dependent dehydrogenase